jgi:hypothetical protein
VVVKNYSGICVSVGITGLTFVREIDLVDHIASILYTSVRRTCSVV